MEPHFGSIDLIRYRYAAQTPPPQVLCPKFLPPLCRTSRVVLDEATPVFVANCRFIVHLCSHQYFERFLTSRNLFASVRSIALQCSQCYEDRLLGALVRYPNMELLKKCPGVVMLDLHIRSQDLYKNIYPSNAKTSLDALIPTLCLEDIAQCRSLRTLTIRCSGSAQLRSRVIVKTQVREWVMAELEKVNHV